MAGAPDHDQNFKNLILDYPRESLEFFAAAEAAGIDDHTRITPIRQEQLKSRLGDRFRELDVPLLVEWPDGRREALLFVLEEETDGGRFSIHRLAHYCLDLAELCKTDRVVPVVIFLRRGVDQARELRLGSERFSYLQFAYLFCALDTTPAVEHWHSRNLVARVNLVNMAIDSVNRLKAYHQAFQGLRELEPDEERRAKYLEFIDIYANLSENERQRYQREYPEDHKAMVGIVTRAREEGIQQGIQQGMQQGMQQGKAVGRLEGETLLLKKQLTRRFGPMSPELIDRLDQASAEQLETWAENLLDAATLEEVFTPR